ASTVRVISTSRRSLRRPATTGCWSVATHSAFRPPTVGGYTKLYSGGGEVVAHSSVSPPQGLAAATAPRRTLQATSASRTSRPTPRTTPPAVARRFRLPQPLSAG